MTDAYTVALSNESVAIACDVAGTALAGELGSGGKATSSLAVYKGPIALTPVAAGATPTVGQYKYVIGTAVGSTPVRLNDSTFYINAVSADTGSILVTIYLEGLLLSITKTLTWNKSKTGATGKAVTSIVEEYYNSTSSTGQVGDSWGTAVPAWVNGRYLWTRTKTTFSDTNTSTTAPICVSGQKGLDGTIYYMWVKYADNADGTIGLSDSPAGKRYIGVAANQTSSTEGTTPAAYTWSPLYDNVVVGGANLWLNSSPEKSYTYWTATDGTKSLDSSILWNGKPTIKFIKASVAVGGLSNNVPRSLLPAATQFTYSFMVYSSVSMPINSNSMGHMQVLGTSDGGANVHRETAITYNPSTIPANKWTKVAITFSTPAEAVAGETFTFRSYLYFLTYAATYYFSDFQLEKGNVATEWTPAPEDVSAQIETKSKTFTSQPANYAVGDIWKENATIKIAITAGTTYNAAHWTLVGDVTSANTAADVTAVNGTAAATIATGAANGTTANSAVTAGSAIWGRASNINSDGTLNTSKLSGTVTDAQVASGTAWNTAKTLVTDITTNTTLTPFEKQTLKPEYDTILKEKLQATTLATSYGVLTQTYYTDYVAAYDALYAGMNTIMTTNIAINSTIVRATVQGWFSTYYDKSAAFQNGINIQAKTLAGAAATAAATAASLAQAMTQGKMLNKDPDFALGVNGTSVYRTGTWSRVTSATDSMAPPTTSGYMMKLVVTGAPGQGGGFTFGTPARANAKFVVNFMANAPIGTTINFATNGIGTGAVTTWLTSNAGTGKWTEYTYSVVCGATGTFADTNYFYFENATYPFNAYVSKATVYDTTAHERFASQINDEPGTVLIEGSKLHFTTAVSMDSTWIDQLVANSIVTNKIQATDITATRVKTGTLTSTTGNSSINMNNGTFNLGNGKLVYNGTTLTLDGTLNASNINAGTLSVDRIAAASIAGDKITANTIDATKLRIGSGAQGGYINNPRFTAWASTYPDGTALWSAGGISKVTVDTVPMAQFAPALGAQQGMTLNTAYFANGIDLDAMQYFTLECRFRLTVGTNPAGACLLVDITRQDASSERMTLNMTEAGATLTTNTWYIARKVFKLADANVAKTFKNVSGFLMANYSASGDAAKTIQFASVNMFQASAQEFLAQSWTNGGTTSINGGMIATDTLSASSITTGIISAGSGVSTINMNNGEFNFGSGKISLVGSTLSVNVDSLKISNSSVATQTYTDTAVTNIEVGGRNTFKKTTSITQASGTNTRTANALNGTTIVSTVAGSVRINNVITENGNWTFSAWVTSTVAGTLTIDFADNSSQTFAISTTRTKISKTGLVANYSVGTYHFIDISGLPISTVTFENINIEKGTKATDWTPAPEDVQAQIDTSVSTTDVEYYLSTSSSSLLGGSWLTTAPAWVNGKYMWSRTKVVQNNGTITYKPSTTGTCIAGAQGAIGGTGTGITSITEEYYLSTSKTVQADGSWLTTPPTWAVGKYMWTRSKIIYSNPTSTVYTVAVVDSSWEAVNEVQIGARNLIVEKTVTTGYYLSSTNVATVSAAWGYTDYIPVVAGEKFIVGGYSNLGSSPSTVFSDISKVHISGVAGSARATVVAPANARFMRFSLETADLGKIKLERGVKSTDWTPAPEDVVLSIETKPDTTEVSTNLNIVATAASTAQATADAKLNSSVYEDFLLEYGEYKQAQAASSSVAAASLEAAKASISSAVNEMGAMKETWTFNNGTKIDATGSGMLLSDEAGGMNLLLSNNRISFFDSGVEVAYIADKTLKINHGIFVKSAQIGAHAISQSPSNPDITIVNWVGI